MAKPMNKNPNKYVRKVVVKKGKKEEPEEENLFNFSQEIVIGVNHEKKEAKRKPIANKNRSTKDKTNHPTQKPKSAKKKGQATLRPTKKTAKTVSKVPAKGIQRNTVEFEKARKKRMRIFKIIKILILIIILLTALILTMLSPLFNIATITVVGNEKLSTDQIISLAGITTGQNTYKINQWEVKEKIKENPYVDTVKITRILPSEFKITITERKASFMLEYGGSYLYISNQGYLLEASTEKIEVPMIQGTQTEEQELKPGNRLGKEDLQKMTTVLKIVEAANSQGLLEKLTRIDIGNKNDYKAIFEEEGKTAHLGDGSNLGTKMLYVKALIEDNKGIAGEIFVNMDLNQENIIFRKQV